MVSENAPLPPRFGRFEVVAELGRGAMGVVYRAVDPALERVVAIKTVALTGEEAERSQHEARFLQEARAAGSLAHPSIITVYDVGREGDLAFMAMELLEGQEVRDLIHAGGLAPSQAVEIAARVAEGLAVAHEAGVIHRDVKPGNIMVLTDGRVKIMDFGIARLNDPGVKTSTGLLLGSPRYMAPEQLAGRAYDHRADIFALGIVLYEMLTGATPFGGADLTQLMFQVMNSAAVPPSHLNRAVPPVLDYILARALKKEPDERYGSATEFAADLRDALPEVIQAEAQAAARAQAEGTGERTATGLEGHGEESPGGTPVLTDGEDLLELRPSPRFDSVEGLARLAVLPTDSESTRSRAGWTAPKGFARPPWWRRIDVPFGIVAASYVVAAIVAVAIVAL